MFPLELPTAQPGCRRRCPLGCRQRRRRQPSHERRIASRYCVSRPPVCVADAWMGALSCEAGLSGWMGQGTLAGLVAPWPD